MRYLERTNSEYENSKKHCIESVFTILWISDLYITGFYWQVNREH